jgi:molybdopterin synthase catalytic subunit
MNRSLQHLRDLKWSNLRLIEITRAPILPEVTINKVRKDAYGCVVTFVGMVRNVSSSGRKTLFLENEASAEELARQELQRIAEEVKARWQLDDIAICHRMGRLKVGEITLVVAIAAPHRREAFEACQYTLDRFKQVVPAWEKEVTE